MNNVRKATAAGRFYPGLESDLKQQIKKCFLDEKRGVGRLPSIKQGEKKIKGLVVPHAGYIFSGAIAAHSYHLLAKNGFAENFIILGPNHTGMGLGVSLMTKGKWETPLGKIPINEKITQRLNKGVIESDENAHQYEHSIEVQLPFLQFIQEKEFDFTPICMGIQDIDTSLEVGKIIAEAVEKTKNVTIIASTDFSHVGFNYQSMPPANTRVDKFAEEQDKLAIEKILELDPKGLIKTVHENNITMCGYGCVAAMLNAAIKSGAKKAELLKYGTSYEVQPGDSCVGYGSIAVY